MDSVGVAAAVQVETRVEDEPIMNGHDPMEVRWGINCVVRDKFIDGDKAGFGLLPFGQFFQVSRFSTVEEIHTVDEKMARERRVTRTAESAERYIGSVVSGNNIFGVRDPHVTDWGCRFGFYGVKDPALMAVISATVLPPLGVIRQFAADLGMASPITAKCQSESLTDFADRESCPTCWLEWVGTPLFDAYCTHIASTGMAVDVIDALTRAAERKIVKPSIEQLHTAGEIVRVSLLTGIQAAQTLWQDLSTEMAKGERKGIDAYQENIRRDLHAAKPQDANLEQVREYARVAAAGNQQGGNDELIKMMAESAMRTERMLGAILEQRQPSASEVAAEILNAPMPTSVQTSDGTPITPTTNGSGTFEVGNFNTGDAILVDGQPGVFQAAKNGGWYTVVVDGQEKSVQKRQIARA